MHAQDHHVAILAAVVALEQTDLPEDQRTRPTMRDLSMHLNTRVPRINDREMQSTMKNLRRRGTLRIVTKIKVDYCSKPVGVYGLPVMDVPKSLVKWRGAMSLWTGVVQ
jgi:hypothetical protein